MKNPYILVNFPREAFLCGSTPIERLFGAPMVVAAWKHKDEAEAYVRHTFGQEALESGEIAALRESEAPQEIREKLESWKEGETGFLYKTPQVPSLN